MAEQKRETGIRSFGVFLRGLADGEAELELSDEWNGLIKEAMDEAKARNAAVKGKLTLTVTVEADPRSVVKLGYDIATKPPPKQRAGSTMFVTPRGHLTAQNPRQLGLPLREVPEDNVARDVEEDGTGAREA